jgi:nitrogen regulatory protein PII
VTTKSFRLVTIICEPVLSSAIIELIKTVGASGFTVTDVRGEGSGEKSSGEVPEQKLKIEVVADATLANKIMGEISTVYFENYSIIVYSSEISILRPNKF